jgi:hypothetical protein
MNIWFTDSEAVFSTLEDSDSVSKIFGGEASDWEKANSEKVITIYWSTQEEYDSDSLGDNFILRIPKDKVKECSDIDDSCKATLTAYEWLSISDGMDSCYLYMEA